jgi:diguanylate cyclase (GGDEF)-like protein/PAS domain S-box-containing protein
MSHPKKSYLHRKLAVSVFRAALLFAAFIAMLSFFAEFKRASEKNRVMLVQLLDTVESTAAIAAYSGNRAIGEDVLKGLLRNDIVHEARLNADGLDIRQARDGTALPQAEQVRTLLSPFGEGVPIGTLSVIPEARYSFQEARYSALVGAINSTAVIGLTALILLFLVRAYLSRPLMKVSDALHAIKAGEKERLGTLPQNRNDELGQLVHDINGLLDTVQEKFEDEHRLLRQIQAVEKQLRGIFENTSAGIFQLDGGGRLQTANRTLARVLGLPEAESNTPLGSDFPALAFVDADQFHILMRQASESGQAVAADLQLRGHGSGDKPAWVHCLLSRHTNSEGAPCFEGVVYDITERRALEMRVRHEADYDPLTGLQRRQAIERDLGELLLTLPSSESRHVVMLLDLDNFKDINDRHGHAAGDTVLVETARRIKSCVRAGDLTARLGGDEFVIVLVNCVPVERANEIARNIVAAVTHPIPIGPQMTGRVGVSIGIAIHDEQHRSMADLFQAADLAMYEVKRQGKNGFAQAGPQGSVVVEKIYKAA